MNRLVNIDPFFHVPAAEVCTVLATLIVFIPLYSKISQTPISAYNLAEKRTVTTVPVTVTRGSDGKLKNRLSMLETVEDEESPFTTAIDVVDDSLPGMEGTVRYRDFILMFLCLFAIMLVWPLVLIPGFR